MCHDPKMYPDPMAFNPARFFNLSPEDSKSKDPCNFVFGFGRRICVGLKFSDNTIFLALASILACFNISKKVVNGKEIIPEVEYPHFVGHPKPFQCDVVLRSREADALIAATAA
jgi:cytochrome P450